MATELQLKWQRIRNLCLSVKLNKYMYVSLDRHILNPTVVHHITLTLKAIKYENLLNSPRRRRCRRHQATSKMTLTWTLLLLCTHDHTPQRLHEDATRYSPRKT